MKVKINTEIDLGCLFDAAHSQKEIHAMMEYLVPHASNETLFEELWKRGIEEDFFKWVMKHVGVRDLQRLKLEIETDIREWCKGNDVKNAEEYL